MIICDEMVSTIISYFFRLCLLFNYVVLSLNVSTCILIFLLLFSCSYSCPFFLTLCSVYFIFSFLVEWEDLPPLRNVHLIWMRKTTIYKRPANRIYGQNNFLFFLIFSREDLCEDKTYLNNSVDLERLII